MSNNQRLSTIFPDCPCAWQDWDRPITHVAIDSRTVVPGTLFFAYPGLQADGRDFIDQAVAHGAVAIAKAVPENAAWRISAYNRGDHEVIPVIEIPRLPHLMGGYIAAFFRYPSRQMTVVGVTGTNGKTSTTYFIAQGAMASQQRVGIIGTTGYGFLPTLHDNQRTTADPITLQQQFVELLQQGAQGVAMEVSSHGLAQGRVNGVAFDVGVFTNLTQDHLDYHGDMESYGAAKALLFDMPTLKTAVINADDAFGRCLVDRVAKRLDFYTYSLRGEAGPQCVYAQKITPHATGFTVDIISP